MRDETAIRAMVKRVYEHYGRIDVLINNPGQGMYVPVEQADIQQYRSLFELNVVGVLSAIQAVIPKMREQGGGVIVNISSGTTKMSTLNTGLYASIKQTLNALTLIARREPAQANIRVGLVYPSVTATNFVNNATDNRGSSTRGGVMEVEPAEQVAEKIAEAIRTEAAEVYTDNLASFLSKS